MIIETIHFDLRDLDDGKLSLPIWVSAIMRGAVAEAAQRGCAFDHTYDLQRYCDEHYFDVQCRSTLIHSRKTYEDDSRIFPVEEVQVINFAWDDEEAKAAFLLKFN